MKRTGLFPTIGEQARYCCRAGTAHARAKPSPLGKVAERSEVG